MSTREQQKAKYWPTAKADAALAGEPYPWPCGDPDCDGRCRACNYQAREDAAIAHQEEREGR